MRWIAVCVYSDAMANRKGNALYDDDDFDDGYDDDEYDDDYWGEDEEYGKYDDGFPAAIEPAAPSKSVGSGHLTKTNTQQKARHQEDSMNGKLSGHMKDLAVSKSDDFCNDPTLRSLCDKAAAEESALGGKAMLNLVVLGHVDAGKSTLMGRMLYETGVVGDREITKAQKEAKAIGKGSFAWAWMLDERPEERNRGVTVDVAMAHFETPHKRVTLLDAPGHRDFVPNMISGASQADAALVVIDGSEGGFESGMSSANISNPLGGGQTREHVQLAQSLGIDQIAIVITKLDTCNDSESRFCHIKESMEDFMRLSGYEAPIKIQWTLAVGLTGDNMIAPPTHGALKWFEGPTLMEAIDSFDPPLRNVDGPLRLSVTESSGKGSKNVVISGKVHQGALRIGTKVIFMPPGEEGTVKSISMGAKSANVPVARAGDTIESTIAISDPSLIHAGSVMCSKTHPIELTTHFTARITVLDVVIPLLHGQNVTLHAHATRGTGVISKILSLVDERTGEVKKERPRCLLKGQAAIIEIKPSLPMPLESFEKCKALARVALRDGGRTLAVGKVLHINN